MNNHSETTKPSLKNSLHGRFSAAKRRAVKRIKSYMPKSKYRPEFQRYRYPGLSLSALSAKVSRFQTLLGESQTHTVEQLSDHIFRIKKQRDV